MQNKFTIDGETISGNKIEIRAEKDCDQFGSFKKCYWSEVYIDMDGCEMNIEDLSQRNQERIIDQLPYL